MDVAAAGLGWFAVGLKGEALLGVWTYDGVDIALRDSLISYRAHTFEVTGFTVSKIISKADKASSKWSQSKREKKDNDCKEIEKYPATVSALTFTAEASA